MSALRGIRTVDKRGAVNWTVGKLINIILVVIVLVLVVYGVTTGGLNPLIEKVEMKFDEVLIMFNLEGGSSSSLSGDCYDNKVADLERGDEFLEKTGLSGESVLLGICDDGSCEMSWKDGPSYRVKDGEFEVLAGEDWVVFNLDLVGDSDEAKFYWELYNGAADILDGTAVLLHEQQHLPS